MTTDASAGWDEVAEQFMAVRSAVGTALVRSWAADCLPAAATILDVGCGSGVPIATALVQDGFRVWGVDAAPRLIAAFRQELPEMRAACEAAQTSAFFDRTFAGVIAIGLIFLLDEREQRQLLKNVGRALRPGGRFLFTAPAQACRWRDTLTRRPSLSLGTEAYAEHLAAAGLRVIGCQADEGGNNYFDVIRPEHTPAN